MSDEVTPREMGVMATRVNDLKEAFEKWTKRLEEEDRRSVDWQKQVEGHFSRITHEMQRFTDTLTDQLATSKAESARIDKLETRVGALETSQGKTAAIHLWLDATWKTCASVAGVLYIGFQVLNALHSWKVIP